MPRGAKKVAVPLAALLAVLVAVLLWLLLRGASNSERARTAQPGPAGVDGTELSERASAAQRASERAAVRLRTYLRGARTIVPRGEAASGEAAASAPHHPRQLNTGRGRPKDRRPAAQEGPEPLGAALSQRMDQAMESAQKCLDQWAAQDDSLDAGVMLALQIDAQGLQEVAIEDRAEVPSGPLKCIADSVYPIDWGGLTEAPIKYTAPIRYRRADAATSDRAEPR